MPETAVHFCNRSDAPVHLIIEPVADTYEVGAGESLTLRFDVESGGLPIEVEYHGTEDVGIWTHAVTQAFKGDEPVRPA